MPCAICLKRDGNAPNVIGVKWAQKARGEHAGDKTSDKIGRSKLTSQTVSMNVRGFVALPSASHLHFSAKWILRPVNLVFPMLGARSVLP